MTSLTTATPGTLTSFNPATGEPVGEVAITPVDHVTTTVQRSREALASWRDFSFEERKAALMPASEKLQQRSENLGRLLTNEMGKPLTEGVGEVSHCGESLEKTLDEIIQALQPETLEDDSVRSIMYRDPYGVCGVISPWNFPLAMPHWMVIPALMAGNTVVLKPSEETPLIAQAYVDVLNESLPGVSAGVLQIIHGDDAQGKALVSADVDLIAFTGSAAAGRHILGSAASGLKRVILELGGKDPMIVLDDADIEAAAAFAVRNSFRNAGQVCVATERIYVDEKIASDFEDAVVRLTSEQKVGEGTTEDVTVGPMINSRQRDQVLKQVEEALADGATVIAGGEGHHDNFIMPTVLTNVNHDMRIMRDETFGPVACIQRFTNDLEAVALANDTPYGLGASVFGKDESRAAHVARRLDAGMIGVNKGCGGATGSPWVGAKQSGYGFHSGKEGHRQFTQPRVVSVGKCTQ